MGLIMVNRYIHDIPMIFSHAIPIASPFWVREITDELPLGADWAGRPGRPGAKSEGLHGCLEVDM